MQKITKYISWVVIIILITLLFLQRECYKCPTAVPEIEYVTRDSIRDTIIYRDRWHKPTYIDTIIYVDIPQNVDTQTVLKDYYALVHQLDSIYKKDDYLIVIDDTLTQNKIKNRQVSYRNDKPTIYNTYTFITNPATRKIFLGAIIGGALDEVQILGTIMYQSKKDHAYTLSYDPFNKHGYIGFYYKLNFKKKK